ncbi:hypothetical protein MKW92_014680, partial [Papaver armeniacum]
SSSSSVSPFFKAKTGCDAKCGNVSIPYPFGIINPNGNGCSIGGIGFDYRITCNTSFNPPNPFLDTMATIDVSRTPFTFSYTENMFFAIGCNTYATIYGPELKNYSSTCSSECNRRENVMDGSCFGKGCCQSTIPKGLKRYEIRVSKYTSQNNSATFDPCSY